MGAFEGLVRGNEDLIPGVRAQFQWGIAPGKITAMLIAYEARQRLTGDDARAALAALPARITTLLPPEGADVDETQRAQVDALRDAVHNPASMEYVLVGMEEFPGLALHRWIVPRRTELSEFVAEMSHLGFQLSSKVGVTYVSRWQLLRWILTGRGG